MMKSIEEIEAAFEIVDAGDIVYHALHELRLLRELEVEVRGHIVPQGAHAPIREALKAVREFREGKKQ